MSAYQIDVVSDKRPDLETLDWDHYLDTLEGNQLPDAIYKLVQHDGTCMTQRFLISSLPFHHK